MSESEWEVYNPGESYGKNKMAEPESEWEVYNPQAESVKNNENVFESIVKAPLRMLEDLYTGGTSLANQIPSYYQTAKTELPGLPRTLYEHPGHAGKQALAGLEELINKVKGWPVDIAKYGEERLNLVPHAVTKGIESITPRDTNILSEMAGEPEYPGEKFLRGVTRNLDFLYGGAKTAGFANSLTNRSIAKDVVATNNKMFDKYSGPKGKYTTLFNEAEQAGAMPHLNISPNKINFNSIGLDRIKNNYPAIDKLRSQLSLDNFKPVIDAINKLDSGKKLSLSEYEKVQDAITRLNNGQILSLNDYQKAIKEFGRIERKMKRVELKTGELDAPQDARYHAAINGKSYLQENMFKDANGKQLSNFLDRHKDIQTGYATEAVPYTTNRAIKQFQRGEIDKNDLVKALRKNPFRTQRGRYHQLSTRDSLKKLLYGTGGALTASGLYTYGENIYDKLNKD